MADDKKNARRRHAWIVFEDESGISERPSVRRTWAPRGQTPVLIHSFSWKKASLCAALAYRWDGRRAHLMFQIKAGSYNAEGLLGFLQDLKAHFRGKPIILVWDGLPAHKSRRVQQYLYQERRWLREERLPAYAPDLNPLEPVWGNVKSREMANLCSESIQAAGTACRKGLHRIRKNQPMLFSFLHHAGLSL